MAKTKTSFYCTACGSELPKWAGRCPDCEAWNTIEEFRQAPVAGVSRKTGYAGGDNQQVIKLAEVADQKVTRIRVGINELDRVIGGGIVPGSVILIGGDPGIGKSTLLLQVLAGLLDQLKCLYVSGEESLQQINMRAKRLGLDVGTLRCLTETSVEQILTVAEKEKPGLLVIDSIQTLYSERVQSAPGSVTQVRESAAGLVRYAKQMNCAMVLVGHVTKDGSLAGPRILEHMVDAVLYFQSDEGSRYRVIRAFKNRFGTVNELGVFAMTGHGLREVSNPSAIFLSGHSEAAAGSVITVTREGTRPMLLELQALVDESHLANPRRVTVGLDQSRLSMLLAVLHRHGGVSLGDQDVFANVVGGIRITETGADLPLILAILSSFRDRVLPGKTVVFGEVGLSGEVRPVYNGEERLKEAAGLGFSRAIIARANQPRQPIEGMTIVAINNLDEAIAAAF
ncbi:MAG: DNA repair protein RadA [Gammaproteobacteria bacterium]|nr:MAG: DNA repair protein RadA [Gammaproteobacteria bacterium]